MLRLAKDIAKAALDTSGLPYRQRLLMTRRGFKPSNYVLYDIDSNDLGDYAADRYWRALGDSNGHAANQVLTNKLLFHLEFADQLPLPRLYGYMARGHLVAAPAQASTAAHPTVMAVLEGERDLIVKPIDGQKGKSVHHLSRVAADSYTIDGRAVTPPEFTAWLSSQDGMLVTSRVEQAAYATRIHPGSANTVRVVTVADDDGPFVLCACHRFGRTRTGPVDNFAAGGLLCGIDLESGVLGRAVSDPAPGERSLTWFDSHPDSGSPITGVEVTGFAALLDLLIDVCGNHPYLTYVGWDAVITADGPVILEANCGSGLQLQAITPFLRNERFARFMRDRGMAA